VRDIATTMVLSGIRPPAAPGQWGQTTTTAADVATFLAGSRTCWTPEEEATLLGWMRSATATAAVDDRRLLHSAGVLDDGRVVVLLGDLSASTSWAQAATALDTAATAARTGTATVG
jgi:hypothetical protein